MATWHDRTWTFDLSIPGSDLVLTGAANKFRLVESRDSDMKIYLYTITPVTQGAIAEPWVGRTLLPQGGVPLMHAVPEGAKLDTGSGTYLADLAKLVDEIGMGPIQTFPSPFERLVGTIRKGRYEMPVTFYRVEQVFRDAAKLLLYVDVNLVGASPRGTVAGQS